MGVPLGVCEIKLNGLELGLTLKDESCSLTVKSFTEEVKTIESPEVKDYIETGMDIMFECSMLVSSEILTTLNIPSTLIQKGVLDVISKDGNMAAKLNNAKIKSELTFNFKEDNKHKIKISAKVRKKDFALTI